MFKVSYINVLNITCFGSGFCHHLFKRCISLSSSLLESDYYKELGINRNASAKEIKRAYFDLAKKCHPDANPGNKTAAERFQKISQAYEVLGNKEKKQQYDAFGSNAQGPLDSSNPYQNQSDPFGESQQWTYQQMDEEEAEEIFKNVFKNFFKMSSSKKSPFDSKISCFFAVVGNKLVLRMMKKSKFNSTFEEYEIEQGPNGIKFLKKIFKKKS